MTTPQGLPEALPTVARTLRRFRPYLGRQRGLIAASLLALFAEMGLRLLEPWPLKVVVDAVFRKLPGSLGHAESPLEESFSPLLEGGPGVTRSGVRLEADEVAESGR